MKCGLVEATAALVEGLCTSFRWLFRFFEKAISAILSMTTINLFVFFNSYYIFCFSLNNFDLCGIRNGDN